MDSRTSSYASDTRRRPSSRRVARQGAHAGPATKSWRARFTTERQAIALLAVAVLVGGGGSHAGIANLLVQLAALVVLGLSPALPRASYRNSSRLLACLAAATIALPLLQVVPLPQPVWSALPGREPISQTFGLIGLESSWFPFSMSPHRTLVAFLSLIPAVVMMMLATCLDEKWRTRLLWTIVGLGIFNVALGAIQLVTGSGAANLFGEDHVASQLYGTFANHNATALFLDIALLALVGLPREAESGLLESPLVRIGLGAFLVLGLVLTQSRSGMFIAIVPLALVGLRFLRARSKSGRPGVRRHHWIALGAAACMLAAGTFVVASSGRFEQAVSRFSDLQDERPHVWEDSLTAVRHYWPAGAGIGAFDDIFQLHESLEYLTPLRAGRAHNDYLEFAIEAGAVGFVLVGAWIVWLIRTAIGRGSDLRPPMRSAAVAVLVAIGLQALIDYPMRTEALLCIAGAMAGLLGRRRPDPGTGS
ncbi:MAG TPA: O-antigen ligase family protein [Novosphingobium sp.]|nr:O-antigen ligase family protein [Novosphingobium sp.]